jgi:hypothetical protein
VCGGKARIDGTRIRVNNVVFVEFLSQREARQLTQAAAKLAEKAFRTV